MALSDRPCEYHCEDCRLILVAFMRTPEGRLWKRKGYAGNPDGAFAVCLKSHSDECYCPVCGYDIDPQLVDAIEDYLIAGIES